MHFLNLRLFKARQEPWILFHNFWAGALSRERKKLAPVWNQLKDFKKVFRAQMFVIWEYTEGENCFYQQLKKEIKDSSFKKRLSLLLKLFDPNLILLFLSNFSKNTKSWSVLDPLHSAQLQKLLFTNIQHVSDNKDI